MSTNKPESKQNWTAAHSRKIIESAKYYADSDVSRAYVDFILGRLEAGEEVEKVLWIFTSHLFDILEIDSKVLSEEYQNRQAKKKGAAATGVDTASGKTVKPGDFI
jgi:hypothetical protein